MKPPSDRPVEPLLVRKRVRCRSALRRRVLRAVFLCVAAAAALCWVGMAVLRPFLLTRQELAQVRHLRQDVAAAQAQNEALRRRARILNTPKGIEVEARRLGWVRPGEILIQTSGTPPRLPAAAPKPRKGPPPLGAVQGPKGFLARTIEKAGAVLERWRLGEP